jgi:hypothetical protein
MKDRASGVDWKTVDLVWSGCVHRRDAAFEGVIANAVRAGFPPCHPSCPAGPARVQGPGGQIEALHIAACSLGRWPGIRTAPVPTRGRSATSPSTRPAAPPRRLRGLLVCRVIRVERITIHLICMMQVVSGPSAMSLVQFYASASRGVSALWITRRCCASWPSTTNASPKGVCGGRGRVGRSRPETLALIRLAALVQSVARYRPTEQRPMPRPAMSRRPKSADWRLDTTSTMHLNTSPVGDLAYPPSRPTVVACRTASLRERRPVSIDRADFGADGVARHEQPLPDFAECEMRLQYPDIRVKLTGTDGYAYALSTHTRHDWPGLR